MSRPHQCGIPTCPANRAQWGRYCVRHARHLRQYGHPLARCILSRDLTWYAAQVLQLFHDHPTGQGLVLATSELEGLLQDSLRRVLDREVVTEDVRHLARLASNEVTAWHVLAMVAAVAIHDQENAGAIPDTRSLHFAVARSVCGLASRLSGKSRLPLGSGALNDIGSLLLERYGPFISSVICHRAGQERAKAKRIETLRQPFTPTPPDTLDN